MDRDSYHHGDLKRALIGATADLIAEEGASGFSLRKVARRAGVSPAAPSHHFGDARGLLTAVATEGFERMLASFDEIAEPDPHRRLIEHGRRYVELAISAPGHMAVMFRNDLIDGDDAALAAAAPQTYERIRSSVRIALDGAAGVDVDSATKTIWSTCHGLAHLYAGRAESLADDPELARLVDHAVSIVYVGMRSAPGGP